MLAAQLSYELVWSDEFNDSSTLNPDIWSFEEGYVRNNEQQYYTVNHHKNCRIENGLLILEAHKEANNDFKYTAASIHTQFKKEMLYGRIEVRAKLPEGRGIWPAIWMLGCHINEVNWPLCGEIDIMEHVGYDPHNVHANVHTQAYNHNLETNKGNVINNPNISKAFHVYAIHWTEAQIDFFIDEQLYFSFKNDGKGDPSTWPFNQPQYLLINIAVGGFWGGKEGIDENIFPQQFLIDYVRYYHIKQD